MRRRILMTHSEDFFRVSKLGSVSLPRDGCCFASRMFLEENVPGLQRLSVKIAVQRNI